MVMAIDQCEVQITFSATKTTGALEFRDHRALFFIPELAVRSLLPEGAELNPKVRLSSIDSKNPEIIEFSISVPREELGLPVSDDFCGSSDFEFGVGVLHLKQGSETAEISIGFKYSREDLHSAYIKAMKKKFGVKDSPWRFLTEGTLGQLMKMAQLSELQLSDGKSCISFRISGVWKIQKEQAAAPANPQRQLMKA